MAIDLRLGNEVDGIYNQADFEMQEIQAALQSYGYIVARFHASANTDEFIQLSEEIAKMLAADGFPVDGEFVRENL